MRRWVWPVLALMLAACASKPAPQPPYEVRGQGQPTVVLASGYGMTRDTWSAVVADLSRDATVFTQDRPGYGTQPDTDRPRDPCTIAADTREALRAAGLPPPYLLVGHSIGGLYQYTFARLYPQEVSGLVLLDPTHPRNWETLQTAQPMLATALRGVVALQPAQAQRNEFRQQTQCLDRVAATAALAVPARLLFSRRYREAEKDFAPALQTLQADWKALAGVPSAQLLWDSGHHIQTERPDAVGRAVRDLAGQPPRAGEAPKTVTVGTRSELDVTLGSTRQPAVSAKLGPPDETYRDGDRTIWVYRAPGLRVPMAVSLIPVIGDLADLVELGQSAVERQESVIEFDGQGVVRHARRRTVED